ncbi:hypothetical protein [Aestuariivirga sp.]|uniref:hypothetical protein n=1 Tax=Aestuariivirga sp. TaxID=2650926 RepID=UPI003BAA07A4
MINKSALDAQVLRAAFHEAGHALGFVAHNNEPVRWMYVEVEPSYEEDDEVTDDMIPDMVSGAIDGGRLYDLELDQKTGSYSVANSFDFEGFSDDDRSTKRLEMEGDLVMVLCGVVAEAAHVYGVQNKPKVIHEATDLLFIQSQQGGDFQKVAAIGQHLSALGVRPSMNCLMETAYDVVLHNWGSITALAETLVKSGYHANSRMYEMSRAEIDATIGVAKAA